MAEQKPDNGGVGAFFMSIPSWAKTIVTILILVPLSMAISGRFLDVSVGPIVNRYLDIQFARMEKATVASEGNIIEALSVGMEAMNLKIDELARSITMVDDKVTDVRAEVAQFEVRLSDLEQWACEHSRVQGLRQDAPIHCDSAMDLNAAGAK